MPDCPDYLSQLLLSSTAVFLQHLLLFATQAVVPDMMEQLVKHAPGPLVGNDQRRPNISRDDMAAASVGSGGKHLSPTRDLREVCLKALNIRKVINADDTQIDVFG